PLGHDILPGVTRWAVLALAGEMGLKVVEQEFGLPEAMAAREAFLTSATNFVMPVTQIDAQNIGNGAPGAQSMALRQAYIAKLEKIY
ncbi:MAG: aminotransferase class IV, partial [Alphaproteobacteria bacterium]